MHIVALRLESCVAKLQWSTKYLALPWQLKGSFYSSLHPETQKCLKKDGCLSPCFSPCSHQCSRASLAGAQEQPCLHKGENNLHHPTWQQVIQALSNGALALLGTGWQRQKIWESRGQQDLTVPLETSACRSSCRLHVTFNAHSCAQRAGNIPDAWARMPGGMKDGVE